MRLKEQNLEFQAAMQEMVTDCSRETNTMAMLINSLPQMMPSEKSRIVPATNGTKTVEAAFKKPYITKK